MGLILSPLLKWPTMRSLLRSLHPKPYKAIELSIESETSRKMAAGGGFGTAASLSIMIEEQKIEITKEMRSLEVAIAELKHISSSRAVFQKNGNIFFRTTVQKATTSEQKKLDTARAKLEKLNS